MGKYAVINPANGETVKDYPDMSDGDLEAAIGAAADAHRSWGLKTSVSERAGGSAGSGRWRPPLARSPSSLIIWWLWESSKSPSSPPPITGESGFI